MDQTTSDASAATRTTLPKGLRGWMTFIGVASLLSGVIQLLSIIGIISGVLMIIGGVALISASRALARVQSVEPGLERFFVMLRRFAILTGSAYLAGLLFIPFVIAAIAIPNLLNAIDRGKQKRTMADIRSIGTAVEAFAVENNYYPPDIQELTPVAGDTELNLEKWISPEFIRGKIAVDGWEHPFLYQSDSEGSEYRIISYGKDGVPSPGSSGRTQDFDCDIIYEIGAFVAWPEGIQT